MPDEALKTEIYRYRTRLLALAAIQERRSALTVQLALWQGVYAARARSHELDLHIAHIKRIQRDAYIILATGLVSCIGSAVITSAFARAGAYAYRTGRVATTMVTTTQYGLRLVAPGGMSIGQMIVGGAAQWLLLGLPAGAIFRYLTGAHGLDALIELLSKDAAPVSPEALRRLRDDMTADGVGDAAFQRLLRDPRSPQDKVKQAIQSRLKSDVASDVAEEIMAMNEPAKFFILMSNEVFGRWRVQFSDGVKELVERKLPELNKSQQMLVFNSVMYDSLNEIKVELLFWDRRWAERIVRFKRDLDALIFSPLQREASRGSWARPR